MRGSADGLTKGFSCSTVHWQTATQRGGENGREKFPQKLSNEGKKVP